MSTSTLPPTMQWVKIEGPRKLDESFNRLKIDHSQSNGRELPNKSYEELVMEKKNVKNELKHYDSCFKTCYGRHPKREEKEPMRPLYMYYKRIKQTMSKKTPEVNPTHASREAATKALIQLRQERNDLRQKLHAFQHEFSRTNNRKIRYHKDIAPVENEYKRYKEVKLEIAKYEGILNVKK